MWGWEDEDEMDIRDKIIGRINKMKREEYKQKLDEIVTSKKEDKPIKKEVPVKIETYKYVFPADEEKTWNIWRRIKRI